LKGAKSDAYGGGVDWLGNDRVIWQTAGSHNYAVQSLDSAQYELMLQGTAAEHESGWLSELHAARSGTRIAYWWNSPNGEDEDGLWTLAWPSRERTRVIAGNIYPAGWSADDRVLWAFDYLGREVHRINARTGKAEKMGALPQGAIDSCDTFPNGNAVICAVRESRSDAWIIENFERGLPNPR
jgi:hypothetical protein